MSSNDHKPSSWILVIVIIAIVIGVFLGWKFFLSESQEEKTVNIDEPAVIEAPLEIEPLVNEDADKDASHLLDPEPLENLPIETLEPVEQVVTPILNESDAWIKEKLASIIWRKELLELVVDDDVIRRFVVFVDNFSQGDIAYSHTPFVKPSTSFLGKKDQTKEVDGNNQLWVFDESNFKRFSLYVDMFRSADSEALVEYYKEIKPLINEAYSELGYPEKDFDQVLQTAITKVLDLEYPKGEIELIRPSVAYRYQSEVIESLDNADKLMLRIGKENLLIIKSVLLDINEKINKLD